MTYLYKNRIFKNIGVLGLGISGTSVVNYFINKNVNIFVWDDIELVRKKYKNKNSKTCNLNKISNLEIVDFLFISPGIKLNHPIVLLAKKLNIFVTGDLDIFWNDMFCEKDQCIAVTGSNGKSTVASIINFILLNNNFNSKLGGNIGIPILNIKSENIKSTYVIEVSSYQLEIMKDLKPSIAILTNLSRDHIERHGSYSKYIKAKERIFMNQDSSDVAIINTDTTEAKKIFNRLKTKKNGPRLIEISTKHMKSNTVSYLKGKIINSIGQNNISLGEFVKISTLKGMHNIENILISLATLFVYGLNFNKIKNILPKFKGLPHRIEEVSKIKNILFVNDSKSTNLSSTKMALNCYKNIIWIAGGIRKDENFDYLEDSLSNIKAGFFIGSSKEEFYNYFNNYFDVKKCLTLDVALNESLKYAELTKIKTTILFSPGCASFDQFKNFEERGDVYKNAIYKYKKLLK